MIETRQEFEARLMRQSDEADAGAFDDHFAEMIRDLISQLPKGYVFENGQIVRIDSSLPDHVFVETKINKEPSGRIVKLVAF